MSFESSQASASIIAGAAAFGGAPLPHFVELRILNGLQAQISEVLLIKGLRADDIGPKTGRTRQRPLTVETEALAGNPA